MCCSGPTLFLMLSGEGAVSQVRNIVGPTDPAVAKETAPSRYAIVFNNIFSTCQEVVLS